MSDLLKALEALVSDSTKRSKSWPKAANSLSNRLRRAVTFLREIGVEVEWGKSGKRLISIRKGLQKIVQTAQTAQVQEKCGFSMDDTLGDVDDMDDATVQAGQRPSTRKATNDKELDDVDDVDDKKHTFSKYSELLEVEI